MSGTPAASTSGNDRPMDPGPESLDHHPDRIDHGRNLIVSRVAIGAREPLGEAARRLLDHPVDELGEIDLREVAVVLPGRRAGRQLLVELELQGEAMGRRLVPPRTTTPSGLVDLHPGRGHRRIADPETWLAAVTAGLEIHPQTEGGAVRLLPADAGPLERRALARQIVDADRVVRDGARGWQEVIDAAVELGGDEARHRGIAAVIRSATQRLATLGLESPEDAIDATIDAIASTASRPDTWPARVVLLGVVDLSPRMRRLVVALAGAGVRVEVLAIVEPEALDRLDELGAVLPEAWDRDPPGPRLERIVVEAGMLDEAVALDERLDALAEVEDTGGRRLDPDAVAVVLADESRGPVIGRELAGRGIDVHLAAGRPLSATPIARTIERLRDWCEQPDTHHLGDLLGDAAFGAAVRAGISSGDPEAAWVFLVSGRMPVPVRGEWWEDLDRPPIEATLSATDELVRRLLGPFHPDVVGEDDRRPTSAWALDLLDLLDRVDAELPSGAFGPETLEEVSEVVRAMASVPEALDFEVTAAVALQMIVEAMSRVKLADPGGGAAIETIGWLEAPFDSASHLVVVGMHDAAVPGRIDDPVLPDRLRSRLGLEDERRRTARDRWVLGTILARDPDAGFILSRRDLAGDPLVPSRLLFGVPSLDPREGSSSITPTEAMALAAKVRRVFGPAPRRRGGDAVGSSFGRFDPPEPGSMDVPAPKVLSVTAFREFLASPYRFWLKRILGLDQRSPVGRELDARLFGIVLHDAVEAFGKDELERRRLGRPATTDVDVIHGAMLAGMDESMARLAGGEDAETAALRLQRRIIERRLRRGAEVEVARALDDWRIHAVEAQFDLALDIPGQEPQPITGRIDRIDHHPEHGWQLLDFKTSDKGDKPDKVHHRAATGDWYDLQLPLYRWAAPTILEGVDSDDIGTGYFAVGADLDRIGVLESDRIDGLQDDAMETAREVVRSIRAGLFTPSDEDVPPWEGDPVSLLMRTTALIADGGEDDA